MFPMHPIRSLDRAPPRAISTWPPLVRAMVRNPNQNPRKLRPRGGPTGDGDPVGKDLLALWCLEYIVGYLTVANSCRTVAELLQTVWQLQGAWRWESHQFIGVNHEWEPGLPGWASRLCRVPTKPQGWLALQVGSQGGSSCFATWQGHVAFNFLPSPTANNYRVVCGLKSQDFPLGLWVLVVPEVMLNLYPVSPYLQSQTTRNSNHQIEKEHPIQTVDYVSEEIIVDFLQYVYRYYRYFRYFR